MGALTDIRHMRATTVIPEASYLSPRMTIHLLSIRYPELIHARIVRVGPVPFKRWESMDNFHLFFVEKIGVRGKCILVNPWSSIKEQLAYRYQIALDGIHATNPGYAWRLLSGCLVFKQSSPYVQWFYEGLEPYVHFIPVERDLSDLLDKVRYAIANDLEAKQIGANSREFAEKHLSLHHFFEHALYVLEEYARIQNAVLCASLGR